MRIGCLQILSLLLTLLLTDGCRRRKTEQPAAAPENPASSGSAPQVAAPAAVILQPAASTPGSAPAQPPPRPVMLPEDAAVQRLLVRFYNENQRPAMVWADLVPKYLPAVPTGSDGKPLDWDSTMQRIGRASDRSRK